MKKYQFFNSVAILVLGLAAVGCSNEMPEYKGTDLQEQAKSNFPVENIDPNQDWDMAAYRTASINVGGDASKAYDVYVLSELPTSGEATPTLASQKGVKGGTTLQLSFDVAKAQETVYIGRNGEDGYFIKPVTLSGDTYTIDFSSSSVGTRAFADKADEMSGNPFASVISGVSDSDYKTSVPSGATLNGVDKSTFNTDRGSVELTKDCSLNYVGEAIPSEVYVSDDITISGINNALWVWYESENIGRDRDDKASLYTNIYVLPDHTLTLNTGNQMSYRVTLNIYVAKGATLKTISDAALASGASLNIYNKGTLDLGDGVIGNFATVYNEGTLKANSLNFPNGGDISSMLINKGTVKITGDVTMVNGANILNDSYMYVGGSVAATQSSQWFVNTGNLTVAKDMDVKAGNNTFYNGCQIKVDGTLNLDKGSGDAAFNVLSDGAFYCTNLILNNQGLNMGSRAAVVVTGTSTIRQVGGDIYQGFKGTGSEQALVELGNVEFKNTDGTTHTHSKSLCAEGNLLLTADNMADIVKLQGDTNGDMMVEIGEGATWTTESAITVTPNTNEDEGCLTWKPKKDEETKTEQITYTYGFEDMLLGDNSDYDFNDVVLYVTTPDADGNVTVTLEAAGATRQIAVKFKDKSGKVIGLWDDVHTALGVAAGTMVNTGNGTETSSTTPSKKILVGTSLKDNGDFYIVVDGTMEVHIPQYTAGFKNGDAPYAIQVPVKWQWPTERTYVTESYTNFASWVKDVNANTDWYKTVTISNVYSK